MLRAAAQRPARVRYRAKVRDQGTRLDPLINPMRASRSIRNGVPRGMSTPPAGERTR